MSTITDFSEYRECGACYYLSYSFGPSGWLSGFICTHHRYLGRPVCLYDFCHLSDKDFYL